MKFKHFETLKKNKDFQKVYKEKKINANRYIVMYIRKNEDDHLRLGVSVSKKVGNSVIRHRLTRLVREAFRLNSPYIKPGFDVITVVREDMKDKGYRETSSALVHLLKKHKIFKDKLREVSKRR